MDKLAREASDQNVFGEEHTRWISDKIDPVSIFREASRNWDGGYALAGILGTGDCFAMRDPKGIRPGFYFEDDEVFAVASERAPLMTVFDKGVDDISEIQPGGILVVRPDGSLIKGQFSKDTVKSSGCSFERIYFSRGNDPDIYAERKTLGALLVPQVVDSVGSDFSKSVFSYVPNTAESAYYGFMEQLRLVRRAEVKQQLIDARQSGELTDSLIDDLVMDNWPRGRRLQIRTSSYVLLSAKNPDGLNLSHMFTILPTA